MNTIVTEALPRLTVAAVVPQGDRFLFVQERVGSQSVINQPAGHVDLGESVLDAVIRETLEESAWQVRPQALIGIYQLALAHAHYLRLCFLCSAERHFPERTLDQEIERALWLTPDQLRSQPLPLRSPLVMRCLEDHLAGRRWPLSLIGDLVVPGP